MSAPPDFGASSPLRGAVIVDCGRGVAAWDAGTAHTLRGHGIVVPEATQAPLGALLAALPAPVAAGLETCVVAAKDGAALPLRELSTASALRWVVQPLPGAPAQLLLCALQATSGANEHDSLAELAGAIAHGFNNLLVGVMGNLDLARYADEGGVDQRHHLDAALAAAERAADLCRQLLAYSGRGPLRRRERDLDDELRRILPLLQHAGRGRVHWRATEPAGGLRASLDSGRLTQLVQNLVDHCAQAIAPEGHIEIVTDAVRWPEPHAARWHWAGGIAPAQGDFVRLTVHHDGTPLDEARLPHVFAPHFDGQLDGRGLGLPAAAGIVRQHGGAIGIARDDDGTTRLCVLWPAVAARTPQTGGTRAHRHEGVVLIVDDEPAVRDVMRLQLERLGYRTMAVENGLRALEILAQRAVDVIAVVLDQTMPVLGGPETFGRLRELAPELPVVLTTGYGEETLLDIVARDSRTAFLPKPYALDRLRAVIESVTGRSAR